MACANALTPVRVMPVDIPAHGTKTHGTIGRSVGLMVRDVATQSTLPIYEHKGEYWVAGTPNQAYELWLTSRMSPRRVLATTSVDGVNVITGETAAPIGRGYVLSPHSISKVAGWRKSEHEVAAFRFAAPEASYAAQTGRPANVGVIGVAIFPELYVPPPLTRPSPAPVSKSEESTKDNGRGAFAANDAMAEKRSSNEATAASADVAGKANASSSSVAQGLGTQHGERVASYAPTVAFKRESNAPAEIIQLRYDTIENLVARGVLQWQSAPVARNPTPQPFPKNSYVPDPPHSTGTR